MTETEPLFRETQRFRQTWLWALMAGLAILALCAIASELIRQKPALDKAVVVGVWVLFGLGAPAMIFMARLGVEVRPGQLRCRFFPFHLRARVFDTSAITKCMPCEYRPIRDFGGWGIRRSFAGKGWAYNVSGSQGVQIVFNDGRKLLIGSQRPEELALAILDSARA